MNIELSWAAGGVIMAVVVHAIATIRASAKLETKVEAMSQSLERIDRELEKRDIQITALWKRADDLRDMIPGAAS